MDEQSGPRMDHSDCGKSPRFARRSPCSARARGCDSIPGGLPPPRALRSHPETSATEKRGFEIYKMCIRDRVQESSARCLLHQGPGASPGVSLVPFWTFRKGPAPQGGHLYGPPAWGGRKGATSSVTASAVTPSPEGKAFGGHSVGRATLPQGEAA